MDKYDFFFDALNRETVTVKASSLDEAKKNLKKTCRHHLLYGVNMAKTFDGIMAKVRRETKAKIVGIEWVKLGGEVRKASINPLHFGPTVSDSKRRPNENPDFFVFTELYNKKTKGPKWISLYKSTICCIKTNGQKITF